MGSCCKNPITIFFLWSRFHVQRHKCFSPLLCQNIWDLTKGPYKFVCNGLNCPLSSYVYITISFQECPFFRQSLQRGLALVIWASQRYWRHACWTWPSLCFFWPPFGFSVVLNMFFCKRCWRRTCWTKPTRQSERELLTWATHSWYYWYYH